MKLAETCVKYPVFTVMLIAFLVTLGIFSYRGLAVDLFPKADPATVNVNVQLPGATPEEVITGVVLPLEDAISSVSGIDEINVYSSEGFANITCTFVLERDIEGATQDIREKVAAAINRLPRDTLPPIITKEDPQSDPIMTLLVSGPMSRFNSWLNELQPEMFVEMSPELASERGIVHGGWVTVESARGRIEARAMVTRRLRPLLVEGRVVHQIGLPFHWAFAGEVVGGNANDLTSLVADPNVSMHESKAFACQIYAGRLGVRAPTPTKEIAPWPTRDPVPDTPASAQPEGRLGGWQVRSWRWSTGRRRTSCRRAARCRISWIASSARSVAARSRSVSRRWGSTPIPRCASAARRARWPARSGTSFPAPTAASTP
jgi:autonomous glycyl radical cofactor GrcA